jgi:hypothetical protein
VTGSVSHVRHRELDATRGRWLQRDSLEYEDGTNSYEVVRPITSVDPSGEFHKATHEKVTNDGLKTSGLSPDCIKRVRDANTAQDGGTATGTGPGGKSVNHYDNNQIKKANEERAKRFKEMSSKRCAKCDDIYDVLDTFGTILHADQDFYSHTNYVELNGGSGWVSNPADGGTQVNVGPGSAEPGDIGLYGHEEIQPGLISGEFYGMPFWLPWWGGSPFSSRTGHGGLNKDTPNSSEGQKTNLVGVSNFDLAVDLATRQTNTDFVQMYNSLDPSCKQWLHDCCGIKAGK